MQKRFAMIGAGALVLAALGPSGAAAQRKATPATVVVYKSPT